MAFGLRSISETNESYPTLQTKTKNILNKVNIILLLSEGLISLFSCHNNKDNQWPGFGYELKKKINGRLREQYTPRHVPDTIEQVSDIPYTISGKKMEAPVKRILMGEDPAKCVNRDTMRNPEALKGFV